MANVYASLNKHFMLISIYLSCLLTGWRHPVLFILMEQRLPKLWSTKLKDQEKRERGWEQIREGLSKKRNMKMCKSMARHQQRMPRRRRKRRRKSSATKPATPQKNTETLSSTKNNRKSISAVPTSDKTTRTKTHQPTSRSSDSSEGESHNKALHQNLNPSRMALPKSHGKKAHRLRLTQRNPKAMLLYSRFRLHLKYLAQPQNFHYRPHNAERAPQIPLPHPHHPAKPELQLRNHKQQLNPLSYSSVCLVFGE